MTRHRLRVWRTIIDHQHESDHGVAVYLTRSPDDQPAKSLIAEVRRERDFLREIARKNGVSVPPGRQDCREHRGREMAMILDLSDEEARALLNVLIDTIEAARYPMSPRIRLLREIIAKFGGMGPVPPRPRAEAPSPCTAASTANAGGARSSRRPRQGRRTR